MLSRSDTTALEYIMVLRGILLFKATTSPGLVATEAYYCAYVGNIFIVLYLVLHIR